MYAKYYNTPLDICRLSSEPGQDLGDLLQQADQLINLERLLRQALPNQLRGGWRLSSFNRGVLTLQCENAALATRIRLQQVTLLDSFGELPGLDRPQRLIVKVRPNHYRRSIKRNARPISSNNRVHIMEIAQGIEDEALRSAMQKLAENN